MPEQEKDKSIQSYYKYITTIIDIATQNWIAGEGNLTAKVNNEKGYRQAKIEGLPTTRISEREDD